MTHYGFFMCECNDVFHSVQGVFLGSSTSPNAGTRPKGLGTYIFLDNFRRSVSLFSVRSLIKSNWIYKDNSYISPLVKDMGK